MSSHEFQLELADQDASNLVHLSFSSLIADARGLDDPVISGVCGSEIDYGSLFACCFRRFGYPNLRTNSYEDLACYLLTTPRDDMLLQVIPHVSNKTALSFNFLVPLEVLRGALRFARRELNAWEERALLWREQQALPAWMDEWLTLYNEELRPLLDNGLPEAANWREAVACFPFRPIGMQGTRLHDITKLVESFRDEVLDSYAAVEACPERYRRSADWTMWADDDVIKPYAAAAVIALHDLARPVGVRDQAINAYGLVGNGA